MKKILFITVTVLSIGFTACKKSDFADNYTDPSKIGTTTVEKQFTGFITSFTWTNTDKGHHGYVVPQYWNYFVVLRATLLPYTQATGWINFDNQYIPGDNAVGDRWKDYYNFLTQYRELELVYSKLPAIDQQQRRIYMIAAAIFLYDQTQKVIDLHGDIPWSEAGRISENKGNYMASLAKYDDAATIYTKMLDDLKAFSEELNTISPQQYIKNSFITQDLVNKGDITLWKKYCNSLRIRMLTRLSGVAAFQPRVNSEIAAILSNQGAYPVVASNADNIKISVYNLNSDITAASFKNGLEGDAGWQSNMAGKAMIDHMNSNTDPRLAVMFEPGDSAKKVYIGLDPLSDPTTQSKLLTDKMLAIYNRSTLSRNSYFPGILINAAEVNFLKAEYYLKMGNDAQGKIAYETGIQQSIEYYYWLRTLSNDFTAPPVTPPNSTEINNYIANAGVSWKGTDADKIKLIATQKWIHFSVVQPYESWAEIRRLNAPALTFRNDISTSQKQPPTRWFYPTNERVYNAANYEAVKSKDDLNGKIFWDLN
jgi:hypothetical protein